MINKPQWQERVEEMKIDMTLEENTIVNYKWNSGHNDAIDQLIPIIAEEMQKQREEVIEECIEEMRYILAHLSLPKSSDDPSSMRLVESKLQALKQKKHD